MLRKFTFAAFCILVFAFSSLLITNSCKKSKDNGVVTNDSGIIKNDSGIVKDNNEIVKKLTGNWVCSGTWHMGTYLVDSNGLPHLIATDTTFTLTDTLVISATNIDSGISVSDIFSNRNRYARQSFTGFFKNPASKSYYFYCDYSDYDLNHYKGTRRYFYFLDEGNKLKCSISGSMGSGDLIDMMCETKY